MFFISILWCQWNLKNLSLRSNFENIVISLKLHKISYILGSKYLSCSINLLKVIKLVVALTVPSGFTTGLGLLTHVDFEFYIYSFPVNLELLFLYQIPISWKNYRFFQPL